MPPLPADTMPTIPRHTPMGWTEAADLIVTGIGGAIAAKTVTYDLKRQMEGATLRKCSEFGDDIIHHME